VARRLTSRVGTLDSSLFSFTLQIDPDFIFTGSSGELVSFIDHAGFEWLGQQGASLCQLQYSTFTESAFSDRPCNRVFGRRQGQDGSSAKAGTWLPARAAAFVDSANCSLWMQLEFPVALVQDYGAPATLWLHYNFSDGPTHVDVQLLWFNKTATRIAESLMFGFTPSASGSEWWMRKLGAYVQPHEVVQGGNPWQHAVSGNAVFSPVAPQHLLRSSRALTLTSLDAPLVAPIIRSANGTSASPLVPHTNALNATQVAGVAWNLFNNMFETPPFCTCFKSRALAPSHIFSSGGQLITFFGILSLALTRQTPKNSDFR
jgi:hypothetical protein